MARSINDIVLTGNGLLVTFDDNVKKQFVWEYVNNNFTLTDGRNPIDYSLISEIIDKTKIDSRSSGLWTHLFGTAGFHVKAASIGQIGDSLTTNVWEVLSYDTIVTENHTSDANIIFSSGEILFPTGEFLVSAYAMAHRSGTGGTDGIIFSIHAYDNDLGAEVPFSFTQGTSPALNNSTVSIQTSFFVDNNEDSGSYKNISVRVHSDSNRCTLGANNGKIPSGSQNNAGYIDIIRVG